MEDANHWASLEDVRSEAIVCCRCDLCHTRTHVVFGEGPPGARAMIVGEGPGREEDESARPFVGRAGKLLDRLLCDAGLDRSAIWITNIVRCRPTASADGEVANRPPKTSEVRACDIWTAATYGFIDPCLVMCLGGRSAQALLGEGFRIGERRGRWHVGRFGKPTTATYHPAYVLRLRGADRQRVEEQMVRDLVMIRSEMEQLQSAA